MKKAKHIILLFLAIIFLIGCSKRYEEDPWTMKFVRFNSRFIGEWEIQKILIDGADSTYILYVDTLKIFAKYRFYKFNDKAARFTEYQMVVKTYNESIIIDTIEMQYTPVLDGKGDVKFVNFSLTFAETYFNTYKIYTFGAINNFIGKDDLTWEIHKLTPKVMHLTVTFNNKLYELFFKKISK